jgi:hypothetical protein
MRAMESRAGYGVAMNKNTYTLVFLQCKQHKKTLIPVPNQSEQPFAPRSDGGYEVIWGTVECPKGKRNCMRRWRVVLVEKRYPGA